MQSKEKDTSRLSSLLYERFLQIKRQGIMVRLYHQERFSQNFAYIQCQYKDANKMNSMLSMKIGLQICDLQGNLILPIKSTQYVGYNKKNQDFCRIYINKKCLRIRSVQPDEYILVKINATISILKDIYYKKIKENVSFYPQLQQFIDGLNTKIDMNQQDRLEYNFQADLNQDQNKAINKVFQSYITFIKGPPGCGKTRTVSRMVRLLGQKGLKIIVGSVSNIANYSLIRQIICQIQEHNYLYQQYYRYDMTNLKKINLSINYSQVAQERLASQYPDIIHYSLNYQVAKKILQINTCPFYNPDNIMQYIYKMKRNENIQATFYTLYMQALNIVVSNVDVMISTTISSVKINTKIQNKNRFQPDIGILDEAAQASWGDGYIFLSLGIKRLVLVGDQKQLTPTVIGDAIENKILKQTMFESLGHLNKDYFIQLTIQYRMHPQIVQFPNQFIYENKLRNGISKQNVHSQIYYFQQYPISFVQHNFQQTIELVPISNSMISINSNQSIKQYYNQYEASLIMQFLQIFPIQQLKNVGIITFYDMQYQILIKYLKQKVQNGLVIKTIDGYQGGQKDYIILSTVRCNSQGKVGFCAQQNRVNVSLTRARKGLIVFGNPHTLMQGKQFDMIQHNIWGKFYKFIYMKNKLLDIQMFRNILLYTKSISNIYVNSIQTQQIKQNQQINNKSNIKNQDK